MQFPGYWISGDVEQIVIARYAFDDTELSEASNWKEAHQNEESSAPHGFVNWEDALTDIKRRLNGELACPPVLKNPL